VTYFGSSWQQTHSLCIGISNKYTRDHFPADRSIQHDYYCPRNQQYVLASIKSSHTKAEKKKTKTKYTLGRNKTANMPPGLQGTLDPNEKVP